MMNTLALLSLVVSAGPQQFTQEEIPYLLSNRGGTGTVRHAFQEGRIRTSAPKHKVTLNWIASARSNREPDWAHAWDPFENAVGAHKVQGGQQEFSTRYYPTASCAVDGQRILVGGISLEGKTVIESWSLQWPPPMPAPVINSTTGLSSVTVALPSRAVNKRLLEEDTAGRRFVKNLCAVRPHAGPCASALVQFHDSNDVYVISLDTHQLTLLASADNAGGTLGVLSGLAPRNHYGIEFGRHKTAGHVYKLRRGLAAQPPLGSPSAPPVVILVDSDRNGTIEGFLMMSESDFAAQGWDDLENYDDGWLN